MRTRRGLVFLPIALLCTVLSATAAAQDATAGELSQAVDRWFDRHLAGKSAAALRHAAIAARAVLRAQVRMLLPEAERLYLQDLMCTEDAAEGIEAFINKRPPSWQDR